MIIVFPDSDIFKGLNFDQFKEFGEVRIYEYGDGIKLADKIRYADIIVSNGYEIDDNFLNLTSAKYICLSSTGFNNVDIKACQDRKVLVSNNPGYGTESVAQLTMTHILNLANGFYDYTKDTKDGRWSKKGNYSLWRENNIQLKDKTLGIIGYGAIGKRVSEMAAAFGMKILTYSARRDDNIGEFLSECDIVSIHTPLSESTKNLISYSEFKNMKKESYLICTSRGGIIDEEALLQALEEGLIAGCGLDVLSKEPPEDNRLINHPKCYVTPHIGWALKEARELALQQVYENIKEYIKGEPINLIK